MAGLCESTLYVPSCVIVSGVVLSSAFAMGAGDTVNELFDTVQRNNGIQPLLIVVLVATRGRHVERNATCNTKEVRVVVLVLLVLLVVVLLLVARRQMVGGDAIHATPQERKEGASRVFSIPFVSFGFCGRPLLLLAAVCYLCHPDHI